MIFQEIHMWFHENWPDDLEWPADIPRPQVAITKQAS